MSIKYCVYIINWDKIFDNTLKIEKDFIQNNIPHTVINSSNKSIDGWMNLGNDSWANDQLKNIYGDAVKKEFDYIFLLYGDVKTEGQSFSEIINTSLEYLNDNKCAIYTKSFTFNHWGTPQTIIADLDEGIKYICATDFSFVAINNEVFTFMNNFIKYFYSKYDINIFKSGWGLDFLCWIYSICKKIPMVRDTNINLIHNISQTGYNQSNAHWEMGVILDEGVNFISKYIECDINKPQKIKQMLQHQYESRIYNYGDFYGLE